MQPQALHQDIGDRILREAREQEAREVGLLHVKRGGIREALIVDCDGGTGVGGTGGKGTGGMGGGLATWKGYRKESLGLIVDCKGGEGAGGAGGELAT
eukprot:scaffold149228_cov35-Tisochrysis_lutea.AAC.1